MRTAENKINQLKEETHSLQDRKKEIVAELEQRKKILREKQVHSTTLLSLFYYRFGLPFVIVLIRQDN